MEYKRINKKQAYGMMELDKCNVKRSMASLIAGLEYGMVRWNGKWNGDCTQLQLTRVTGTVLQG